MLNFKKVSQEDLFKEISKHNDTVVQWDKDESSFKKNVFVWTTSDGTVLGKAISINYFFKEFYLVEK